MVERVEDQMKKKDFMEFCKEFEEQGGKAKDFKLFFRGQLIILMDNKNKECQQIVHTFKAASNADQGVVKAKYDKWLDEFKSR